MTTVIQAILNSEDLPTPPGVALRLLELYSQPDVEVVEMANVIGADPSLSAKLIEYCNSPLLAREQPTTSIRQAIVVIGMRAVKILALSFSLVRTAPSTKNGFDYDAFWSRSLATAVVSKTFGSLGDSGGDEDFLLGLMMAIGRVGLAHTFPGRYSELTAQSLETGVPMLELERSEWSVGHFEISAELMKHWSFPKDLVHQAELFASTDANHESATQQVRILTLAFQVVKMLFEPDLVTTEVEKAKDMAESWLGVAPEHFAEVFDRATQSWMEYASLLRYDATQAQTFDQLERRALKGIAQLSMGLHAENAAMNRQNAMLKINATVDSLTGLKNRRAYDEDATSEWERSNRMHRPLALMMIDIDHFKSVNDTHGHAVGDRALIAVAEVLKANVRNYDLVYRFGGEEFIIIVPECDPVSAVAAANRYREAIAKQEIPLQDGVLKITASFGVTMNEPPNSSPMPELLEEADKLLYQAKREGRNCVCSNLAVPRLPRLPTQSSPSANPVNQQS